MFTSYLLISTISISSFTFITFGQLGCNNYLEEYSSGQCVQYGTSLTSNYESISYKCEDNNGTPEMNQYWYNNTECSGAPSLTGTVTISSSYECLLTQESCGYAYFTTYSSMDGSCTPESSSTTYASYLLSVCVEEIWGSSIYTCNGNSVKELEYTTSDCTGSSTEYNYSPGFENSFWGGDYTLYCSTTDSTTSCNEEFSSLGAKLNINYTFYFIISSIIFLMSTL